MSDVKRQLKLKSAAAKRLLKEFQSYQQEETREKQRLEKLISEKADETSIKQQKNVISETSQMIPYCKKKLEQAVEDLNNTKDKCTEAESDLEELNEANDVLLLIEDANVFVKKNVGSADDV
ncbi:tubulin-folding cofactor A [Acrasis kona]|uniref:Tubulin-specific chaperone A n=1 Tax=Acrasis kona TaxID=1008807 RepID=A0AAW2Z3C8_9EUKA